MKLSKVKEVFNFETKQELIDNLKKLDFNIPGDRYVSIKAVLAFLEKNNNQTV